MPRDGARLDVNGDIAASPGEDDVSAAVDKAAGQAGGYVTVTLSGGFFLEAAPSGDGLLSLACGDEQKGQRQFATAPVTRAAAKALFSDFLAGGDAWRRQCKWRTRDSQAAAATNTPANWSWRSLPEWLAGGGAFASMLLVVFVPALFPAGLVLALCIFVATKAWREARIRRWPRAVGQITASSLQPRRQRFQREATRLDNIPSLGYEFSVAGRRYVGSRLGLNTEYAGIDVGALIARYPAGAIVPVYYNPANPNDCLLDRDANRGLFGQALKLFAVLAACFAALWYGASSATHAVAAHYPDANAGHVVFASTVGLMTLVIFVWSFRPKPRTEAPLRTSGAIVKSELEEISVQAYAGYGGLFALRPTIEVAYSVSGQNYVLRTAVGGRSIAVRTRWFAKMLGLERILGARPVDARARLAPYPVGETVNVLYSPSNPGAAWLEGDAVEVSQTFYRVVVLAFAFACGVMATIALGVL